MNNSLEFIGNTKTTIQIDDELSETSENAISNKAVYEALNSSGGGHVYSTEEQVVGKWIDGSDVYEKTFVDDVNQYWNGLNASTYTIDLTSEIGSIKDIIWHNCKCTYNTFGIIRLIHGLNYYNGSKVGDVEICQFEINTSRIRLYIRTSNVTLSKLKFTIRYLKN